VDRLSGLFMAKPVDGWGGLCAFWIMGKRQTIFEKYGI
jgi:hypothetical protein